VVHVEVEREERVVARVERREVAAHYRPRRIHDADQSVRDRQRDEARVRRLFQVESADFSRRRAPNSADGMSRCLQV